MSTTPNSAVTDITMEPLLDERAAGALLGLSISRLQKARLDGSGPAFVKLGRAVRYRPSALRAFVEARDVRSTSETPRAA